jgi:hypothetical protein
MSNPSQMTSGVSLAAGGSGWDVVSDANMKTNLRDLDGEDVLSKLARIPIREWNYITQDASIRHVGPMARDFHAAFGLGGDDRRINTLDPDGISLKAIPGARPAHAVNTAGRRTARGRECGAAPHAGGAAGGDRGAEGRSRHAAAVAADSV